MKNVKRLCCLLTLLSFALLPGCGRSDSEWIYEYDTIERSGEEIDILIGHDQEAVNIYYDDDERNLLDKAALPTQELHDKNWEIAFVDTSDYTGDGNSDLRITLNHADESESYIVWEWEKDKGYVYRPDDSWFYMALMLSDDDISFVYVELAGHWYSQTADPYEFIEFDVNGNWKLCFDECNVADSGYLRYEPKEGVFYLCSDVGGAMDGSYLETYGDEIYVSAGYSFDFDRLSPYVGRWLCVFTDECDYLEFDSDGNWQLWFEGNVIDEGYLWYDEETAPVVWIYSKRESDVAGTSIDGLERDGGFWFYDYGYFRRVEDMEKIIAWIGEGDEDSEKQQHDISIFEGTWHLDNDLSAESYIVIDGEGNWSCCQRAPGDAEGTETEYGTFSYSADEVSTYYAESYMYDNLSIRVFELGDNTLLWGEDTNDRLEW